MGYNYRHPCRGAAAGELHHDLRMCERRKEEAAILLGNNHHKEARVPDELPDFRWQVVQLIPHLPVIAHAAELLHRTVDERLLFSAECGFLERENLVPVGLAAEELAVPPHRAGIEGFLLRL